MGAKTSTASFAEASLCQNASSLPTTVQGYADLDHMGRIGQCSCAFARFTHLTGSDKTAPWNSLGDQCWHVNVLNGVGFGFLAGVAFILFAMYTYSLFILHWTPMAERKVKPADKFDAQNKLVLEETALHQLRMNMRWPVAMLVIILFTAGVFMILFTPLPTHIPNQSQIKAHLWHNTAMLNLETTGICLVVLSLYFSASFLSVSANRAEGSVLSVPMRNTILCSIMVFFGVSTLWTMADATSMGDPEILKCVAAILFFVVGIMPPLSAFCQPRASSDPDQHVTRRRLEFVTLAVAYFLLTMSSIFMTLPIKTYNCSYYALSEDSEPVYWWTFVLAFAIFLFFFVVIVILHFTWICRPLDDRSKSHYQLEMEKTRHAHLTADEAQVLADLDAVASVGAKRSRSSKGKKSTSPKKKDSTKKESSSILAKVVGKKKSIKSKEGKRAHHIDDR